KAPYQPLAAVPAYALYRALGGEGFPAQPLQTGHETDVGLWFVTFWSATVPLAILIVMFRRHVARFHPDVAVKVALAMVFGTVLLPFGSLLFGHMLAALVGYA